MVERVLLLGEPECWDGPSSRLCRAGGGEAGDPNLWVSRYTEAPRDHIVTAWRTCRPPLAVPTLQRITEQGVVRSTGADRINHVLIAHPH
jgi:hypothetical protein